MSWELNEKKIVRKLMDVFYIYWYTSESASRGGCKRKMEILFSAVLEDIYSYIHLYKTHPGLLVILYILVLLTEAKVFKS